MFRLVFRRFFKANPKFNALEHTLDMFLTQMLLLCRIKPFEAFNIENSRNSSSPYMALDLVPVTYMAVSEFEKALKK
jgi:hypothetical protein